MHGSDTVSAEIDAPYPPPSPLATAWMSGEAPSPTLCQACRDPMPGERDSIGILLICRSLTTHSRHDFVQDEQCTILLTYQFHGRKIPLGGSNYPCGSTNHGLCDNCDHMSLIWKEFDKGGLTSYHSIWAKLKKLVLQFLSQPLDVLFFCLVFSLEAFGMRRRYVMEVLYV